MLNMDFYFDTCSLNRLVDAQTQLRIRQEAEAVDHILELVESSQLSWAKSSMLEIELSRIPDELKQAKVFPLLTFAQIDIPITDLVVERAQQLEQEGLRGFDALHLSVCEKAGIPTLLTVDDRFIRRANKLSNLVFVENPVDWLRRTRAWQPSQQ